MDYKYLKQSLNELGQDYVSEISKQLIDADKVATGSLLRSLSYKTIETANGIMLVILSNSYMRQVNDGRRPGVRPPISKITEWVKVKRIKIGNFNPQQMGFVISNSIGRKGIKPTHILEKSMANLSSTKEKLIQEGLQKDIDAELKKAFEEINR